MNPVFSAARRRLGHFYRWLVRDRKTPVTLLDGSDRVDGTALRILYIGERRNREYLRKLIFAQGATATDCGSVPKSALHRRWSSFAADADVAILRVPHKLEPLSESFFTVPVWIDVERDLERGFQRLTHSKSGRSDLRRIRRHGYSYRIAKDQASFDSFYHDMYLPYVRKRHDEASMPISYQQMQANVPRSELLLVTKDDQALGGTMLVYGDDQVHSWKLGVRDGDTALVKNSIITAVYVFEAQYLHAKRVKHWYEGGTRTFLRDGQFAFKKKWGISLGRPWDQYFYIKALRPSPGARAFLTHNPFLHLDGEACVAAAFIADASKITARELTRLVNECSVAGMRGLTLYCLEGDPGLIDVAQFGPAVHVRDSSALW